MGQQDEESFDASSGSGAGQDEDVQIPRKMEGAKMNRTVRRFAGITITLISSLIMIFIGIVYFMLTIWMIKIGARWAGFVGIDGNWVVLTAGIVTAAAMLGSAIRQ